MRDRKFTVHPESGAWGVAEEGSGSKLLNILSQTPISEKNYLGTHSVILNTTNRCNMDCLYCSASKNRSAEDMPVEVANKTILETSQLELTPRIVFHGSEPLLNFSLIKSAVKYGESLNRNVLFYIQSNLTSLNDKKLDFIRKHNIGVSTSIDGSREQHNLTRPFRSGAPTYDVILKNMERIIEQQEGMCTATVVTRFNVESLSEIALDLEERGVTHIQFLPVVKCGDCDEDYRPSNAQLTEAYIGLFEQTFRRMEYGEQRAVIRNIPQLVLSMFLRTGVDSCRICSSADYHPILAVDINGDIYPCDYFFGQEEYSIGNIINDSFIAVLNSDRNPRARAIESTDCGECDIRRICGGGCMADRIFSGDKPYYCETYERMYKYLGLKMPELEEKGLIVQAIKNL